MKFQKGQCLIWKTFETLYYLVTVIDILINTTIYTFSFRE